MSPRMNWVPTCPECQSAMQAYANRVVERRRREQALQELADQAQELNLGYTKKERKMGMTILYSVTNLPTRFSRNAKLYRKTALTRMVRIDGPFLVETSEGPLYCADGFLALDARGYPYPIATDEHALIYEEVTD